MTDSDRMARLLFAAHEFEPGAPIRAELTKSGATVSVVGQDTFGETMAVALAGAEKVLLQAAAARVARAADKFDAAIASQRAVERILSEEPK